MAGRIKQTLCWWCFARSTEPETIVKEAVALGIHGIELAPPEHWDMIKENGLKLIGTGGHGTFSDGLNRRENHDRGERRQRVHERLR